MMVAKDKGKGKPQFIGRVSAEDNNEVPEVESGNDYQMPLNAMELYIYLKWQVSCSTYVTMKNKRANTQDFLYPFNNNSLIIPNFRNHTPKYFVFKLFM